MELENIFGVSVEPSNHVIHCQSTFRDGSEQQRERVSNSNGGRS